MHILPQIRRERKAIWNCSLICPYIRGLGVLAAWIMASVVVPWVKKRVKAHFTGTFEIWTSPSFKVDHS